MLIDILIPTYNRGNDLVANLKKLQQQIAEYALGNKVQIIISDNCSTDNTAEVVTSFIKEKDEQLEVLYYRNDSNIGLEKNALAVLKKAVSPYVVFLGDDDFLAANYLAYCIEKLDTVDNLGCIIPGIMSLFKDGTTKDVRGNTPEKILPAGYDSMLEASHWGHQMSGILCKREGLLDAYLENETYRNPYLFLFFTACSLYNHVGIYNPQIKTQVNAFNEKDWGYNKVGLLDEVYKCYYAFEKKLKSEQITALLIRFTILHSYRLAFSTKKISVIYKQYSHLIKTTPPFKGFKKSLRMLFLKDGIKALLKK